VSSCDTFEGPSVDELVGDFEDLDSAITAAKDELAPMMAVYIYDDVGQLRFNDFREGLLAPEKISDLLRFRGVRQLPG
jgi:hypothetical protein